MSDLIRLDKLLADSAIGTRTEVKKYIKNGRVRIDDRLAKDPSDKVDPSVSKVYFDATLVRYEKYRYYLFNKPAGCVSATKDKLSDTVISFLEGEDCRDLFPVGRLDKDTEGLLLITNDGVLAHNLLSPKKHVDKVYHALVTGELSAFAISQFQDGLDIGDNTLTLPAKINKIDNYTKQEGHLYEVTIHEGRYHQIKRMFEAVGENVIYLKRLAMGSLKLDMNLEAGQYRRLTDNEIDELRKR